ncbi:MAG: hypothetical protein P8076_05655 [Gammaproteobacteria bacterium]
MQPRACLCGAQPDVRQRQQITADGTTETLYWVGCPVCGAMGPQISDRGRDAQTAIAEAIAGWNAKIAATRPLEA